MLRSRATARHYNRTTVAFGSPAQWIFCARSTPITDDLSLLDGPGRTFGRTPVQMREVAHDATVAGTSADRQPMNWVCSHYRCQRTDVAPVAYWVLGFEFLRILCPEHQPLSPVQHDHRDAA